MTRLLNISPLFFLISAINLGVAQNFPVRVTPLLAPPYTPFLTDYFEAGSNKLTLHIVLNDVTIPDYRYKLRLTIEGVNISITTNPAYTPLPLTLSGGVPEILYGSDIADYFKNSNLIFKGISQQEFEKKGNQLPEGIYRFSFEVLDYNRGTVVSNKGSATAWMILNDPPFLNLPTNNAKLKPFSPQNIVFQWTPRHSGSPNAAFTTEYDVKLVEIWPKGRNPYDAINTALPIFEITTDNTMIVYGPAETPLVLGREYALQVRARDTGGKDLFKNNGNSEVVRFVYGDECPMPSGIQADEVGTARARIRWQGNALNSGYTLRYREKKEGAQWFEENTDQTFVNTTGMSPGATYEYQMCGECEAFRSEYTKEQTFTTLTQNPNAFICGNPNSIISIDGSGPLPALMINDFIKAGGFDVVVTHAIGSNGKFSGDGLATVPWFNGAKVRVTFENIAVNKNYQLTSGFINSKWNKDSKLLFTDENKLTETNTPSTQHKGDVQTFEADTTIIIKETIIASVFQDPEGNIVVQTSDGSSIKLEKGKSYALADEVGNGYLVDKEGNVTKTTANAAIAAGSRGSREYTTDPNMNVRFAKSTATGKQSKYGFDEKREGTLPQNYQQTENGKWVAWKALGTGQQDFVQVMPEGTIDISKIRFQLEGTTTQTLTPDSQTLTITGKSSGTIEELLAYYPQLDTSKDDLVAGKLNLVSYEAGPNKKLVLISVNETKPGFTVSALGLELNKIYEQAVVGWDVDNSVETLQVNNINANTLDDGGSGLLSNYTPEMKQVLNAYLEEHQLAEDTYYIFLLNNTKSGSKLGYMPRSKQAGFIFLTPHKSETEIIHTIAHELGHGVFRLRHTFSEEELIAAQNTTDNLMDYTGGIALDKYQWDYVHNPESVIGLFEDDEEGAYKSSEFIGNYLRAIRKAYRESNFLTLRNTHQISRPDEIRGGFYLMENQLTYPEIVINRHWQNGKEISFEIGTFNDKYEKDGNAGIAIYDKNGSLVITIELSSKIPEREKFIASLYHYLFWKAEDGNNLTLFVSGFNLPNHSKMLKCASLDMLPGLNASMQWEKIGKAIGYSAANNKHFIQDLKETIISKNCQTPDVDPFIYNYSITFTDKDDYWGNIDDQFIYKIGSSSTVYANGDNTIGTALSDEGFQRRKDDGKKAAIDLITKIQNGQITFYKDSKIDVIAHSMGFAFALGMIEELQNARYNIGWVYSIAPENPAAGYVPGNIDGIWQYGSQESDPFYNQDGIAPQRPIPGINRTSRGGRVPIDNSAPQDFFNSHKISNYEWIFRRKSKDDLGYVESRK